MSSVKITGYTYPATSMNSYTDLVYVTLADSNCSTLDSIYVGFLKLFGISHDDSLSSYKVLGVSLALSPVLSVMPTCCSCDLNLHLVYCEVTLSFL